MNDGLTVAFRADASQRLGAGHIMRCLTLAAGLAARGSRCTFVSRPLPPSLAETIRAAGHEVRELDSAATEESDARRSREWLAGGVEWLVVDHYGLGRDWETAMRGCARRVLVIDDLADRDHDCDLLLDQNLYPNMERRYSGRVPAGARLLIGPCHALLREEFALAAGQAAQRRALGRILVSFGGSDPTDESSKTLRALASLRLAGVSIDVLVGAANPRATGLGRLAREVPGCNLLGSTAQMARLMLDSDLMIGAGGSTTWERCCLALPALVIAVAENQLPIATAVADRGYHRFLGSHEGISVDSLSRAIGDAVRDFDELARGAAGGPELVDGQGTGRVIEALGLS